MKNQHIFHILSDLICDVWPISLTHPYIWWQHQWLSSSSWWGTEDWERVSQQGADLVSLLFSPPLLSPLHDCCWSREWLGLLHDLFLSCAFWMSSYDALLLQYPPGFPPQWPASKKRKKNTFHEANKNLHLFSKYVWHLTFSHCFSVRESL